MSGGARFGSDYTAVLGEVLTFAGVVAGETQTFTVSTIDDRILELDEIFGVRLGGLDPATLPIDGVGLTPIGTVTISANDALTDALTPVTVEFGAGPYSALEGGVNEVVEVLLSETPGSCCDCNGVCV